MMVHRRWWIGLAAGGLLLVLARRFADTAALVLLALRPPDAAQVAALADRRHGLARLPLVLLASRMPTGRGSLSTGQCRS